MTHIENVINFHTGVDNKNSYKKPRTVRVFKVTEDFISLYYNNIAFLIKTSQVASTNTPRLHEVLKIP